MQQISLFQLNQLIQSTLDENLDSSYWVVAEIGELRVNQKGHCYMEFVEKQHEKVLAKLRANLWAYDYHNLNNLFRSVTGQSLGRGMKILARVMVQFHEVYGLSVLVKDLDPNFTLGEKARQKQMVIDRLSKEGLIDENSKLILPLVPQRIAVISSQTAAGYGDFMDQLTDNPYHYHFDVKFFEAVMQGEQAVHSITKALMQVQHEWIDFDVLVMIRGGGSQIDLDCFDSYDLAISIANSKLPVFTGIGHQRDDTVADLVAHTSLKTPTAVAEFLLNGVSAFEAQLDYNRDRIKNLAANQLEHQRTQLLKMLKSLHHSSNMVIKDNSHKLTLMNQKLGAGVQRCLKENQITLHRYQQRLANRTIKTVDDSKQLLKLLEAKLTLADPQKILQKGYTITYLEGNVVKDNTPIKPGDQLETRLSNKKIISTVQKVKK